jgi:DNA-binding GntR family transcriptional regulator
MSTFPYADRPRLVDEIRDFLREQIYSGVYPPGTPLRQEQVAEELQVSRTPLREALRILQSEGLLSVGRGNRVEVISRDNSRFLDALVLREVIDGAAARLCAEKSLSSEQRAEMDAAVAAQRDTIDPWDRRAFAKADADLHVRILDLSGNHYLRQQVGLVRLTIQVFQTGSDFTAAEAELKIKEHAAIVKAIAAGDSDGAETRAREHIRRAIKVLSDTGGSHDASSSPGRP